MRASGTARRPARSQCSSAVTWDSRLYPPPPEPATRPPSPRNKAPAGLSGPATQDRQGETCPGGPGAMRGPAMHHEPNDLSPQAALDRLIAGNRRFLDETTPTSARAFSSHMATRPQRPFAIVLGCSDSRTPVEILFDEGFGDLFVVRIAGNIVAPSVVGSIEFAASAFGSRLVVVMGHSRCGAVAATVE